MRQILARSKHTLMISQNKWSDIQRHRVNILFKYYPILKAAYSLAMELRKIFNAKISPTKAMGRMNKWYEKVMALGNNNFRSVIKTFKNHAPTILNYFRRRATNASAEAFNSKVKIFRSQMRGVRDRNFFTFRRRDGTIAIRTNPCSQYTTFYSSQVTVHTAYMKDYSICSAGFR